MANDFIVSPRLSRRSKVLQSSASLPASILEKSRMSLITESRASPESLTVAGIRAAGRKLALQHQLRHADDGVQRRADLVAHVGQEGALGAAGGLGGVLAHNDCALAAANSASRWWTRISNRSAPANLFLLLFAAEKLPHSLHQQRQLADVGIVVRRGFVAHAGHDHDPLAVEVGAFMCRSTLT